MTNPTLPEMTQTKSAEILNSQLSTAISALTLPIEDQANIQPIHGSLKMGWS